MIMIKFLVNPFFRISLLVKCRNSQNALLSEKEVIDDVFSSSREIHAFLRSTSVQIHTKSQASFLFIRATLWFPLKTKNDGPLSPFWYVILEGSRGTHTHN
jgi:hypothetical protein